MKSLSLNQPHLLIMVGLPGSGKSFFAEKFSETFHAPCIGYDKIMEISGGNKKTSADYTAYLLNELFKTNHTIIIDGASDTRAERNELKRLSSAAGYKTLLIWVQTDEATAKSRSAKQKSASRGERKFIAPSANEQPLMVISGKHTYATQAKAVLKNLASTKQAARPNIVHERHAPIIGKRRLDIK